MLYKSGARFQCRKLKSLKSVQTLGRDCGLKQFLFPSYWNLVYSWKQENPGILKRTREILDDPATIWKGESGQVGSDDTLIGGYFFLPFHAILSFSSL